MNANYLSMVLSILLLSLPGISLADQSATAAVAIQAQTRTPAAKQGEPKKYRKPRLMSPRDGVPMHKRIHPKDVVRMHQMLRAMVGLSREEKTHLACDKELRSEGGHTFRVCYLIGRDPETKELARNTPLLNWEEPVIPVED